MLVYASATSSLTELRLRETGREWKCIHPLRNYFGSNALIAAVLLQSPEGGSYSAAAAPGFSASPSLARTSTRASARASACASSWQGLGVIRSRRLAVAGIFHWQLVSAHSVIGTHSRPDTKESWRKTRPSTETQRVEMKHRVRPAGDCRCFPVVAWFSLNPAASKFRRSTFRPSAIQQEKTRAVLWDRLPIAKIVNVKVIGLEQARLQKLRRRRRPQIRHRSARATRGGLRQKAD